MLIRKKSPIKYGGVMRAMHRKFKHGVALGDAVAAISEVKHKLGTPPSLATVFQGNAQAFEVSLAGTPLLIAVALVVII